MLLTENELRSALEPLLDRLLAERLRLFQLQFEPRIQALLAAGLQPEGVAELQEALHRIGAAATVPACFAALFEASAALVGPNRALLVVYRGQAMVWRAEGLPLPERFPLDQRTRWLEDGGNAEIRVRGQVVGLLHWGGAALPAPVAARLDAVTRLAGLVLLELGLPPAPPGAPPIRAATAPPESRIAPEETSPAGRFAALLIEDLRLYLEKERGRELREAVRDGRWPAQFAPEIERCRRAFVERHGSGELPIFEGVASRLGE